LKIKTLAEYEHSGSRWDVSYLNIDGTQSNRREEYVTKSRSISKGIARSADHVIRSNQHNRHADQCDPRGDDEIQCDPRGDDERQWSTIVWLDSLEFQFVINKAVICLVWSFSLL